jgi:hypothetical protein
MQTLHLHSPNQPLRIAFFTDSTRPRSTAWPSRCGCGRGCAAGHDVTVRPARRPLPHVRPGFVYLRLGHAPAPVAVRATPRATLP